MSSYHSVSIFLEDLDQPSSEQDFDQWWETQWTPHYHKCMSGAKHVYVMDSALGNSNTIDQLKENITKKCIEVGFDVEDYMALGWHRAVQKFNKKINDDE